MTATPCTRGCTYPGTDDTRPAAHGRYCAQCYRRIHQALIQAPELAAHILANVTSTGGDRERVDRSKSAPLPFNEDAFTDVNELYSLLVFWQETWADYLEIVAPAPAARAHRRRSGTVIGLPTGCDPAQVSQHVHRLTRWMLDRLDQILTLAPEDVDEFDTAIRDVWRMNAKWPRLERPRFSTVPCPDGCGSRLAVYPPAMPGAPRMIMCESGHVFGEDEYDDILAAIQTHRIELGRAARKAQAADVRAAVTDESRAAQVRAHLIAKYVKSEEAS